MVYIYVNNLQINVSANVLLYYFHMPIGIKIYDWEPVICISSDLQLFDASGYNAEWNYWEIQSSGKHININISII